MKTTYVALKYWGSYEDKEVFVIYAGNSHEDAVDASLKVVYKDGDKNNSIVDGEIRSVNIEHWEDGKKIKDEEIYS